MDPKYQKYNEVIQNGVVIGFTLEGDKFFYKFDQHGGWFDADGKYFNKDAIQSDPPEGSDSDEEDQQDKKKFPEANEQKILNMKLDKKTQRLQVIRELLEIVDTYPEEHPIQIQIEQENGQVSDHDLNKLLNELKIQGIFKNQRIKVANKKIAEEIIDLEGKKINNSTIYIYISLFNSTVVEVQDEKITTKKELENLLEKNEIRKNVDFANIQESEKGFSFELVKNKLELVKKQNIFSKIYEI